MPIEDLKNESLKNPNIILIKDKYKKILNFGNNIFNGEKIICKTLYASFEGKRKISTIFKENNLINKIIEDIQQLNQNFDYGFRIIEFYDYHLFEGYSSIEQ